MRPFPKIYLAYTVERLHRFNRPVNAVALPISLRLKGRIYRGHFTLVGQYLVVTCGSVSTTVEMGSGHPEPQAREALRGLAKAGQLRHFAAID